MAFVDVPNLFALPQPNMDELVPVEEVDKYTKQEYTTRLMEAIRVCCCFCIDGLLLSVDFENAYVGFVSCFVLSCLVLKVTSTFCV